MLQILTPFPTGGKGANFNAKLVPGGPGGAFCGSAILLTICERVREKSLLVVI